MCFLSVCICVCRCMCCALLWLACATEAANSAGRNTARSEIGLALPGALSFPPRKEEDEISTGKNKW